MTGHVGNQRQKCKDNCTEIVFPYSLGFSFFFPICQQVWLPFVLTSVFWGSISMQVVYEHSTIIYNVRGNYWLYNVQEAGIILSGARLLLFGILLTPWVYVVIMQSELNSDSLCQKSRNKSKQRQHKKLV